MSGLLIPTSKQLNENAVKGLYREGFSEKDIIRLVSGNYAAAPLEIKNILRKLKDSQKES